MSKHYKKSIIYPEKAREWLARYESGEALKTIAHNDHFDIRTVKRQVEEAISERDMKEVRHTVLRAALEKHFNDFVALAEKMRTMVAAGTIISLDSDAISLLDGLKQHLPRSPLWEHLGKYQFRFEKLTASIKLEVDMAKGKLPSESSGKLNNLLFDERKVNDPDYSVYLRPRRGAVFSAAIEVGANRSDFLKDDPQSATAGEVGTSTIAHQPSGTDEAAMQQTSYGTHLNILIDDKELLRLQHDLGDELTTIVLRRVVPGRCRYCPV